MTLFFFSEFCYLVEYYWYCYVLKKLLNTSSYGYILHNIHLILFKTFILCTNSPPDNCDKFRSGAGVATALVGPSEFKSYALKQFFSTLRSVILGISQKRKSHTQ